MKHNFKLNINLFYNQKKPIEQYYDWKKNQNLSQI